MDGTRDMTDKEQQPWCKINFLCMSISLAIALMITVVLAILTFYLLDRTPPECGTIPEQGMSLVINGSDISVGDFPFYVSIKYRKVRQPHCGGSVISPDWVLTAKHCVYSEKIKKICETTATSIEYDCLQVVARAMGSVNITGGSVHSVIAIRTLRRDSIIIEEEDIALISIDPPFTYTAATKNSRGVTSVCLPAPGEAISENELEMVGLGVNSEFHETTPEKIMSVKLKNLDVAKCFEMLLKNKTISEVYPNNETMKRLVCTSTLRHSEGACYGDSGGPLTAIRANKAVQVGVTNFVPKTGCGDVFSFFTNVAYYRKWIRDTTGI